MIAAFGPGPDCFFLAHGTTYHASPSLPSTLLDALSSGTIQPAHLSFLALSSDTKRWAADNLLTGVPSLSPTLPKKLSAPLHARKASYVSFPAHSADGYFVKGTKPGAWTADLEDEHVRSVAEARRDIDGFDPGLERILFGPDGSHIFVFANGFQAKLGGAQDDPSSPLHMLLEEYARRGPGWTLGKGSALSAHDPHTWVLVFQNGELEEIRWSAPPDVSARITQLIRAAESESGQKALADEERKRMAVYLQNVGALQIPGGGSPTLAPEPASPYILYPHSPAYSPLAPIYTPVPQPVYW